jgi:VanZ family protein
VTAVGRLSLWGPVAALMGVIFYLSAQPDVPLPDGVDDKTAHYVAYMTLGLLVVRALARGLPARVTTGIAVITLVITIGYGATDEWHQSFVPGRSTELADLVADSLGAVAAVGLCWAWGMIAIRSDA